MKNLSRTALVCALLVTGCGFSAIRGNGHITTDQRTVGDFNEIDAGGQFDIEWRSGPPLLSITTDQNLLQHIDSEVTDNRLRLRSGGHIWPTRGIKVIVSSPTRNGAKLTGAVELRAGQLSGSKFYFQSRGASKVRLDGTVDELLADMTGASELEANDLHTKIAEVSTTGAADAEVNVSDSLKVSITGAGKVTYSGNPANVEKHITGAGSIRHRD
jgi:Putative auto-transporter adhesin, head GIN domain